MDVLQRLQPLDILFAILWACVVGWGLHSGTVRQVGMLVGVYAGAIAAGVAYQRAGQALSLALGADILPLLTLIAYVGLFALVFVVVALILWRLYPLSRLGHQFGLDNLAGAAVAAVWGILLLIGLLTMLRLYAVTPWKGQDATQLGVRGQIEQSQVAPVLELVTSPLWQAMTPWFPTSVPPHL